MHGETVQLLYEYDTMDAATHDPNTTNSNVNVSSPSRLAIEIIDKRP
jgi:hypothetical protein